jgi:drug/metabolite transporter (DMT)-like permease
VVFNSGLDAGVPLTSMLAILGGALCWAEALIVVKAFPPVHPAAMNSVAMAAGTIVLLALTAIFDEAYTLPESASTWGAQAYLVIAGSIGVFLLYVSLSAAGPRAQPRISWSSFPS